MSIASVVRGVQMMKAARDRSVDSSPKTIVLPGLVNVQSQVAVPGLADDALVLVLYAEDTRAGRFSPADRHCLQIVANVLAAHIAHSAEDDATVGESGVPVERSPDEIVVRFYEGDGSVFFGNEYVIKSLPGRILKKLLVEHLTSGRTEFTKKELRLDPELKLPPVRDNLDTRLILLRRRLEERFPFVRLEPTGRGRFLLALEARVALEEHP